MRQLILTLAFLPVVASLAGCEAPAGTEEDTASAAAITATHAWPTAAAAPAYDGAGFTKAQILRVADGMWLDEAAFKDAVAAARVTFFGEQHQTAPVQALERWVLGKLAAEHGDLGLAMEHFQRDEQPVIDRYFAGTIDQATFEAQSQAWPGYATYWRPLVEDARGLGRPLFALNVPKEVLGGLYAAFPAWPLDAFATIPQSHPLDATIPARPLPGWDATYQTWFEQSFDYAAHGQGMGLDYPDALHYFTDLAQIRDETMALWVVRALATTNHLLVVAGDWHVQTRLALPDRVARLDPTIAQSLVTVTTAPADHLDDVRAVTHGGRPVADYIVTYR